MKIKEVIVKEARQLRVVCLKKGANYAYTHTYTYVYGNIFIFNYIKLELCDFVAVVALKYNLNARCFQRSRWLLIKWFKA